jgi:hypothetical protein
MSPSAAARLTPDSPGLTPDPQTPPQPLVLRSPAVAIPATQASEPRRRAPSEDLCRTAQSYTGLSLRRHSFETWLMAIPKNFGKACMCPFFIAFSAATNVVRGDHGVPFGRVALCMTIAAFPAIVGFTAAKFTIFVTMVAAIPTLLIVVTVLASAYGWLPMFGTRAKVLGWMGFKATTDLATWCNAFADSVAAVFCACGVCIIMLVNVTWNYFAVFGILCAILINLTLGGVLTAC